MWDRAHIVLWSVVTALKGQVNLALENVGLRYQLIVLLRQSGRSRL